MNEIARSIPATGRDLVRGVVESRGFNLTITAVIVINAITLGLETKDSVRAEAELAHDEREALARQVAVLTEEARRMRKLIERS